MARERCPPPVVVLVRERAAGCRFREDLIKQMQVLRMNVVLEPVAAVLLQPRPSDDAPILDPETNLPLRLPAFVLTQPPRDVADMPGRAGPEQPPLLECELLHR